MSAKQSLRIAVDVGSTFTDVVVHDRVSGKLRVGKSGTTPGALEKGVLAALSNVVKDEELKDAELFLHASTVGLNTLLERSGPVLGMLTTAGFRDVLDVRRGVRRDHRGERAYDLMWKAPKALVERALRRSVHERTGPDGKIVEALNEEDVRAAAEIFKAEKVSCVAITLFNAHANPEHEKRAAAALRAAGFTGDISLSHELSREIYEYERASTTVIDAYVRPRVTQYLATLQNALTERGFAGECLVTRSGGGAATFADATKRPFHTIMSGPVAGAVCAGQLAVKHGAEHAIGADVGGTSFDTCLLVNGKPRQLHEGEILGMPVQAPWIDVRSIGAGGGTIARPEGGLLRVGPQSAGANPGPACYKRGGKLATVTDAAAHLGMLGHGHLAAGVELDFAAAESALQQVAGELKLSTDDTARGVIEVSAAGMSAAIRSVTIEIGEDPRNMTLVPYGGAGPLFACLLMRDLGIPRALVPNHAGNFSACGLLVQEPKRSTARSMIRPLTDDALLAAQGLFGDLFGEIENEGPIAKTDERMGSVDLRYLGQMQTLNIEVAPNAVTSLQTARERFETLYLQRFGYTLQGPLELVTVRATVRKPQPEVSFSHAADREALAAERQAYSFSKKERVQFAIVERHALPVGKVVAGPAIVTEPTATLYLDAGYKAEVLADHTLCITEVKS